MSTFWVAVLITVLVGHVIWFILYAIRVMKDDPANINPPSAKGPGDPQSD